MPLPRPLRMCVSCSSQLNHGLCHVMLILDLHIRLRLRCDDNDDDNDDGGDDDGWMNEWLTRTIDQYCRRR